MPQTRIVTFTTDFGLTDHYAGTMKGVVLGLAPSAQLVDISHGVPAFNVFAGSLTLGQAYPYFPAGTVHVAVVDPGVGSVRRPILVEGAGQFFVGPDNGVFSQVYEREESVLVRHITAERFFLHPVSQTFHGRDIFARIAGCLACGASPSDFGDEVSGYVTVAGSASITLPDGNVRGEVMAVDHFGNLITNIRSATVVHATAGGEIRLRVAGKMLHGDIRSNYVAAKADEIFGIIGSSGYLEISCSRASATDRLGVGVGVGVGAEVILGQAITR